MICPKCNETISDTARFCSGCGVSFSSFNTPTERIAPHHLPEPTPEHDPLVGQVLDGKYEIGARLGEGGMGAVYRARRVHIGDEVAVKVLLRKFVADSGLVERFRREARAAAMLRHPNVVTIYDYGEARNEDAPAYIVMELVEGESLRHLLLREGRLTPERAVALMRDICAGVGAAHRRQIYHRDLKPDNVIVLPAGEDRECETVKVVDFGIAKLRDQSGTPALTQTGAVMGTAHYMSPEQCRGEQLDARSDVYSLGAVLYEMFAGTPPFVAPSFIGVLTKHITDAPPPLPAEIDAPPALAALIMRTLAKEPAARPADATELARELRAAAEATTRQAEAEAQRLRAEEQRRQQAAQAAQAAAEAARQRKETDERQRREAEEQQRRAAEAQRQQVAEAARRNQEAAEAERRRREMEERQRVAPPVPGNAPPVVVVPSAVAAASGGTAAQPVARPKRTMAFVLAGLAALALVVVVLSLGVWAMLGSGGGAADENQGARLASTPEGKSANQVAPKTGALTGSPTPPPAPGTAMQNGLGMKFVWLPKGSFMMGSETGDPDEQPVHEVTLGEGFYMGRYEVTQAQWQQVMGSNPSYFQGCDSCPVESVSWNDVQTFISKLIELNDGYVYRLPTEAEWEYAARAGTEGDYEGDLAALAWYGNNSGPTELDVDTLFSTTDKEEYFRLLTENGCQTHPVGKKQKNAFGLYDMYGNVWELCQDWYHDSYAGAPANGSAWLSDGEQQSRVLRGGSWTNGADLCRFTKRNKSPLIKPSFSYGLRLVAVGRS